MGVLSSSSVGICVVAALLLTGPAQAQTASPEIRHVKWPLLDIVMVPDSVSTWLIVGPNSGTTQWQSRSHLVDFALDPVTALQWVTIARKLMSLEAQLAGQPAHFTPPLRAKRGPALMVLATNPKKPSAKSRFALLVSDSAADVRWKAFASAAQVDSLLTALELAATVSQEGSHPAIWKTLANEELDARVNVVWQPRPVYPKRLASRPKTGRVWMSYIVSAQGRADQNSFFPLLSDDSLFTEAAIVALRQGRFQPAVLNGEPVARRVFQAILFRRR
jgi:hypothetical protein